MNRHSMMFGVSVLAMVFATAVMAGPKGLSQAEAEKLIKGNTAEGMNTKWKKKMTWYFEEFGRVRKLDERGNKGKGNWLIDKKGELCYSDKLKEESCSAIIPRADGGYDFPDFEWKWDKVVPGNPHNLF